MDPKILHGPVIHATIDPWPTDSRVVEEFLEAIRPEYPDGLVLVTSPEFSLRDLDEDEMAKHGWVRAEGD